MMPIVFWASFVPCVKATKPPEISCSRRKSLFTRPGACRLISQSTPIISAAATRIPRKGAMSDGISTFSFSPAHLTTSNPPAAAAEPIMPPIRAWLELEGSPKYQVTRFHVIAPTRPARTTSSVMISWSTIPLAIVAATSKETKAPRKLSTEALRTAIRGVRARVETEVAIEFAVSWKPFVKSKKSATATTAKSVSSSPMPRGS
jgi:hypothetical protein